MSRLSYANVTSTVCLFLALGGSAYATTAITGKDVKNGSLSSADVKDHSLLGRSRSWATRGRSSGSASTRRGSSRRRRSRAARRSTPASIASST